MASGQEQQPKQRASGQGGFVIAKPFGIPVQVSPYWFIIAGVFVVIYATELSGSLKGATTRYLVAAAFVILLYVSVLAHELSHAVVAPCRLPESSLA